MNVISKEIKLGIFVKLLEIKKRKPPLGQLLSVQVIT